MSNFGELPFNNNSYSSNKEEFTYYSNLASYENNNNSSSFIYDQKFPQSSNSSIFKNTPTQYHKTLTNNEHSQPKKNSRVNFGNLNIHEHSSYHQKANNKVKNNSEYYSDSIKYRNGKRSTRKSGTNLFYKDEIDKGDTDAMNEYGLQLSSGNGSLANQQKACYFFKMAADQGNADAMYNYGRMLSHGKGVPKNKEEASYYFRMAAEKGNPKAMNKYGTMLYNGDGVLPNVEKAVLLFKKAADRGDIDAMNNYGKLLLEGNETRQNKFEASRYFKMAADKGDSDAMNTYATMLSDGNGILSNKPEASHYFKMAADKGNLNAMSTYSSMLYFGDGIPVNKEDASHYYKMAADNGNVNAMNNYGVMLTNGEGVPENKAEAYKYIKKAANRGNESAIHNYEVYLNNLKKEEKNNQNKLGHCFSKESNKEAINTLNNYITRTYLEENFQNSLNEEPNQSKNKFDSTLSAGENYSPNFKTDFSNFNKFKKHENDGSLGSFHINNEKKNSSFNWTLDEKSPASKNCFLLNSTKNENIKLKNNKSGNYKQTKDENINLNTLSVRNIPFTADPQSLCDYFSKFGKINSVKILQGRIHGRELSRGIALVDCESPKTFINIINSPNHVFKGQNLLIDAPREALKSDTPYIKSVPR